MLYLCPTPIGNLQDITLRALEVLAHVDLIACEDTRRTRILLDRHGITARVVSFHEHNEEQRIQMLLPLLREGKDVAVVSDAGMPGLSDPGFTLVRACAAEGLPVTVLPGPSAVSTALVLSGLPVDRFAFVGFLARTKAKLIEQLARFEGTGATLVAFESPRRLRASLAAIGERWPDRGLAVCRELTKVHEQVLRGTATEVLERLAAPVRGEIVLVLAPTGMGAALPRGAASADNAAAETGAGTAAAGMIAAGTVAPQGTAPARNVPAGAAPARNARITAPPVGGDIEERARAALAELARLGVGTKKAAALVAGLTGLPARRTYELGLEVRKAAALEEESRP
ncbi:MAG: 16S rRNA (cytidine(1402)-2'-O)-methyltransferase [Actinomycetia bacterium]|nr:16S rRNA (cytidine(1402)-2'-O)-methyltransferase [Actinomycetes bacterium]